MQDGAPRSATAILDGGSEVEDCLEAGTAGDEEERENGYWDDSDWGSACLPENGFSQECSES
jgi:hypothetical protein